MLHPSFYMRAFFIVIAMILFFLPISAGATDFGGASETITSGTTITDGLNALDNTGDNPPTTLTIESGAVVNNSASGTIGVDFNDFNYILLNQGSITGASVGVSSDLLGGSDVTVNNENSIIGSDDSNALTSDDGVFLGNTGTVTNNVAGATILGNSRGVYIENDGVVENNGAGSTITGTTGNGVRIGGTGPVTNGGLGSMITGGTNGVFIFNFGEVVNSGEGATITGNGGAGVSSGSGSTGGGTVTNSGLGAMITGSADGVLITGVGSVTNSGENATITGGTGTGVSITGFGTVTNSGTGAMITTTTGNGVSLTAGGSVDNTGDGAMISSTTAIGVSVTGGIANVTNSATSTITGATGGIVTGTSGDTINNQGTVTSTGLFTAIVSGDGADSITIGGTVVSGGIAAIDAGTGNDTVNLEDGASVNSDITGNTGTDTANLSGTGTFASDFLLFDTLNMNSGDWNLTSSGTHTVSDTQVNGGILRLNGGTLDGDVTANTGGTFSGDGGIVTGMLSTAGGTIAPGNSIGTITADSLDMTGGGNLEIEFDGAGNSDRIELTGATATMLTGGTVTFIPLALFTGPMTYEFIDDLSDSPAVADTFSTIAISPLFTITVLYDMNETPAAELGSVSATIERVATFPSLANTPNRLAIAEILEANAISATGDAADIIAAIAGGIGLDGLRAAMDQLSPETLASLSRIKLQEHRNFKESLVQRLGALRIGDDFSKNKGVAQLALANIDPAFLANYVTSGQRKGSTATRSEWKPFFRAFGAISDLDTEVDHFGFESSTYGVTFGMDKRLNSNLSLGAAAGYASTQTEFDNFDSQGNMRTFHLAAFGEYSANRFRLDSVVSYAYSIIDMDRRIRIGAIDRLAVSDHSGNEFLLHGGAGYDFDLGGWMVGPLGSIEYAALIEDDFVERGAGSVNMMIDGRTTDSFRTIAGMRAAKQFQFKNLMIVPEAHARWTHEWLDNPQTLQAQFTGIPGAAFNIINRELPDDGANVGFSVTGYQNEMAFNISYQSEFGRSDLVNHVFDIGLKMSFF